MLDVCASQSISNSLSHTRAVYSTGVKVQPLKSGSKLARVRDICELLLKAVNFSTNLIMG